MFEIVCIILNWNSGHAAVFLEPNLLVRFVFFGFV